MPAIVAPFFALAASFFAGAAATAGAVVTGFGAVAGALGVSAGTLFTGLASVALIGVEYLLRPTSSGAPAPPQEGPSPTPQQRTIRQSDMPRSFIFGRTVTPGAFMMYETDGYFGSGSISAGSSVTLYMGIYICDGPIDGFDAFICDDETAPIIRTSTDVNITDGSSGANVFAFSAGMKFGAFAGGSNKISRSYAVAFEPVNATEAGYYPTIFNSPFNYYPSLVTAMWPTTCVGKGITAVYTWASTQYVASGTRPYRFPSGFPEWKFAVRGARVYDPRDATQTELQSGAWTLYNTTWKWTENPALIAAHFISWLINENLTAITGVDWASIATAANDCDTLVSATMRAVSGGAPGAASEPFARITGIYYFTTPPREFLSQIMAACDGTYSIDQDGKFTMWIGKWEEPEVTFYENDVGGFVEEFVAPLTESVNEVHSKYAEPQNSYQLYEAPVWTDEESISSSGRRISTISYDLVPSPNQAYHLSQRYARRINGKRKLQITLGPRGMLAFKQRVVGLYLPHFGIDQSVWRVEKLEPDPRLTSWNATLREITEDVFDDDPPERDPATTLKVATAFTASAPNNFLLARYDGSSSGTAYVVISMNQHLNAPSTSAAGVVTNDVIQEQTLIFCAEYSTDNVNFTQATIYLSNYIIRTPDLAAGQTIYVKTRYMNQDGTYSSYSSTLSIAI